MEIDSAFLHVFRVAEAFDETAPDPRSDGGRTSPAASGLAATP